MFYFTLRSSLQRPESSVATTMTRPAVCDPSTASPQDRRVRHMTAAAQVGVGRLEAAAAAGRYSGVKGHPPHSSRGVSSTDDSYRHNGSPPPATVMVRVKTRVTWYSLVCVFNFALLDSSCMNTFNNKIHQQQQQ